MIEQAKAKGEFNDTNLPAGSYWLHRVTEVVSWTSRVNSANTIDNVPPGPGGRCNDWTYPTDHISDGEYMDVVAGPTIEYFFDQDTAYSGLAADGHQGATADDGGVCGANNSGQTRGILCCYPVCVP